MDRDFRATRNYIAAKGGVACVSTQNYILFDFRRWRSQHKCGTHFRNVNGIISERSVYNLSMIDLTDLERFAREASRYVDLKFTAAAILASASLLTAFIVAFRLLSGKDDRFGFGFPITYLFAAAGYFALAYLDLLYGKRYYDTALAAATASAILFFALTAIYLCFYFATKKTCVKTKYAARIEETPCVDPAVGKEKVALPLKRSSKRDVYGEDVNIAAFRNVLQKLSQKPLSFSDREEYNILEERTRFLTGAERTPVATEELGETFMRCVKLCAKYNVF